LIGLDLIYDVYRNNQDPPVMEKDELCEYKESKDGHWSDQKDGDRKIVEAKRGFASVSDAKFGFEPTTIPSLFAKVVTFAGLAISGTIPRCCSRLIVFLFPGRRQGWWKARPPRGGPGAKGRRQKGSSFSSRGAVENVDLGTVR
jgi:hypothetical protein